MIEATCAACGALNRVADADIPVGARFVPCATCKARVPIASKTMTGASSPIKIPAIPVIPAPRQTPPAIPVPPSAKHDQVIDLADLPAPKRTAALPAEPSRPAPKSGLSAALDADLLAPKVLDDDAFDLDDLLAPVGAAPTAPVGPPQDVSDLLAPKHPPPPQVVKSRGVSDLPAPKRGPDSTPKLPVRGEVDLPAPKATTSFADLPAPRPFGDLPAPKSRDVADLPAPKHDGGHVDLPTPRPDRPDLLAPRQGETRDLPAPRGQRPPPVKGDTRDLPGLRNPSARGPDTMDLPTPVRPELPAPKGFFDDLPQPARGNSGLPAPKGFFEDLPQAKSNPQQRPDLPAPLGFFDDLPQAAKNRPEPPAPKGFFDDIPQAVKNRPEPPAPKGFFDDLPQAAKNRPEPPAPQGYFDDLPQARPRSTSSSQPQSFFDDTPPPKAPSHDIDLDEPPATLDLDLPTPPAPSNSLDQLDLKVPSSQIRIQTPAAPPVVAASAPAGNLALDLDDGPRAKAPKLQPKRAKAKTDRRHRRRSSGSRSRTIVLGIALVGALAAGGFYFYQRHAKATSRADEIEDQLRAARAALIAPDAKHWDRASGAAARAIAVDPEQGEALVLGAEAAFGGLLDTGMGGDAKLAAGKQMLNSAVAAGAPGPQLARAMGLAAIMSNQPEQAVAKLRPLAAQQPKDGFLALYLGWAYVATNELDSAQKSFEVAIAQPATKSSGLYARGRARLAAGDIDHAHADFAAILEADKNHIGAMVGLAAAAPAANAAQREGDLLAVLQRKDIAAADPRAIAQAWTLAAEDARRAGRLDTARERYRKALAAVDKDLAALAGLAQTDLRDGKPDAAGETIAKALAQNPNYLPAQLVMAEVEIAQRRLDDAAKRIATLAKRQPPLPPVDQARLGVVGGKLLEAQGRPEAAVDAYLEASKLAGDLDLSPRIAAVATLMQLARKADKAKAAELRARADDVLASLVQAADKDPSIALTLGSAYLEAGDAARAEPLLRAVVRARDDDVGAKLQLARALARLERTDDAIATLKKAGDKDPARTDIGLELARTYEAAHRDRDAAATYEKLLANKDCPVETRGWAGRFYIRTKELEKGVAQGEEIYKVESANPAGMYLRGEGMLANSGNEAAAKLFKRAAELDPDPLYFDAWGRAAEAQVVQTKDARFEEVAIRAYQSAHEAAPAMFNPLAGLGRLYLNRKDPARAVPPLLDAAKLKPHDPEVSYHIGVSYQELRENATAIKWLELSARDKPTADAYWHLGELFNDGSHDKDCAKNLALAVKLADADEKTTGKKADWLADALYQLGTTYIALRNVAGARDAYERYRAQHPKNAAQLKEVEYKLRTELRR